MNTRSALTAFTLAIAAVTVLPACSITRGQSTVGEYIDDATLTTKVKAKFAEAKQVDATSIKVETLNGEVMLSGFAKSADEKAMAGKLARDTAGVKSVKNALEVRS